MSDKTLREQYELARATIEANQGSPARCVTVGNTVQGVQLLGYGMGPSETFLFQHFQKADDSIASEVLEFHILKSIVAFERLVDLLSRVAMSAEDPDDLRDDAEAFRTEIIDTLVDLGVDHGLE